MNKCLFCQQETTNKKFCTKSCSAKFNNPIHHLGEKKPRLCKLCGTTDATKFPKKVATLCNTCKSRKYNSSKTQRLKLKTKCVDYMGGSCSKCNYFKCLSALEFHHKDPSIKEDAVSFLIRMNRNFERLKLELDKCLLVCANCHREIHEELDNVGNHTT